MYQDIILVRRLSDWACSISGFGLLFMTIMKIVQSIYSEKHAYRYKKTGIVKSRLSFMHVLIYF